MTKEENSKIYPLSHISLTLYSCFTEATKAYLFFLAGGNPVLPLCRPMSESSEPCVAFSQDGTPNDRTEPSPSAPEPKRKRLISEASVEESGRSFEYVSLSRNACLFLSSSFSSSLFSFLMASRVSWMVRRRG